MESLGSSAAVLAEKSESVCIVNHETEVVFLLEGSDLVEDTERTGHTVNALCNKENATAVCISLFTRTCENFFTILDIVVTIFVFAADMQTDTVEQTSMALCIIDDYVVTCCKSVDCGNDSLISEVVEERIFLLLELREHLLKFLVISGIARQHSGAHRVCKAPFSRSFSICLANLRMICKSEVVVQAPVQDLCSVENHVRSELSLQTWIHVITVSLAEILADRAA